MDPITASIATGLIMKVCDAAADKGIDAALLEVGDAGRSLFEWLRGRFGHLKELEVLEAAPDSKRSAQAFEQIVQAELVADPEAASELKRLVAELEREEPTVYQQAQGQGNVLISGSHNTVHTYVGGPGSASSTVGVKWGLRKGTGNAYYLKNIGDQTAHLARAEAPGAIRCDGALFSGEGADMAPGDEEKVLIHGALGRSAEKLHITWNDGSRQGPPMTKKLILE